MSLIEASIIYHNTYTVNWLIVFVLSVNSGICLQKSSRAYLECLSQNLIVCHYGNGMTWRRKCPFSNIWTFWTWTLKHSPSRDATNIHSNLIRMLCRHFKISKDDDAALPDVISITYTAVSLYMSLVYIIKTEWRLSHSLQSLHIWKLGLLVMEHLFDKLLRPFLYALCLFQILKVPREVYNHRPIYLHKF